MSIEKIIRAPSRRIPLWLRNNLSPTTSRRSTLKSEKRVNMILRTSKKIIIRTFAGHIDDQIDIDVQITRGGVVHAKLEIRPAPNEFANIICDEKKANEGNKEGEETAFTRAGAIGRGEFGKSVKTLERCRCSGVNLVEQRELLARFHTCGRLVEGRKGDLEKKYYNTVNPRLATTC